MIDVLLFCAAAIGLAAFVAAPLYRAAPAVPQRQAPGDPGREAVSRALRDLEVDHASGLLHDEAYEWERAALEQDRPND